METIPMFPLGSVLLPGEILPLHVFEPRYREMVIDLLESDEEQPRFGVVLIERGMEVGGGERRTDIGTVAVTLRIDALDTQRYGVIALGWRRLTVRTWLPDAPYPIAEIDEFPEGPCDLDELAVHIAAAHTRVSAVHRLAVELGDLPADQDLTISDDPVIASHHLVSQVPLGPADRQRLLAAATPLERLHLLDEALDDLEAVLRFRAS